jgi:hypothetical protein
MYAKSVPLEELSFTGIKGVVKGAAAGAYQKAKGAVKAAPGKALGSW